MKKLLTSLTLATAILLPAQIFAQTVTLTTELEAYNGDNAYLAIYLTDAEGQYQQTLWVCGQTTKYYRSLKGWAQTPGLNSSEYDGKTGATVASGDSFTVTADIDSSMINAGYQIRIDSSVHHQGQGRDDIIVTLSQDGSGKPVSGNTFVKSFSYQL